MKLLTLTFLTCARKACKASPSSFPLRPVDCTLERVESPVNTRFLGGILSRLDWAALRLVASDLGLGLPADVGGGVVGEGEDERDPAALTAAFELEEQGEAGGRQEGEREGEGAVEPTRLARDLHTLLMETAVSEGGLRCASCGHVYAVKEGVGNFLLPAHLV